MPPRCHPLPSGRAAPLREGVGDALRVIFIPERSPLPPDLAALVTRLR